MGKDKTFDIDTELDNMFLPDKERRVQLQIDTSAATKKAIRKLAIDRDTSLRFTVLWALRTAYPELKEVIADEFHDMLNSGEAEDKV